MPAINVSGKELRRVSGLRRGPTLLVCIDQDTLVYASANEFHFWDMATGQIRYRLSVHPDGVFPGIGREIDQQVVIISRTRCPLAGPAVAHFG